MKSESDWTPRAVSDTDIATLATKLNKLGVEYVIFGSIAMRIHGVSRPTEDIDIYLKRTEKSINGALDVLLSTGWFPDTTRDELQKLVDTNAFEYGVIKFQGEIGVDIVTSMGEQSIDTIDAETKEFDGVDVRVITLEQLLKMKSGSLRDRDQQDYQELLNRMRTTKTEKKSLFQKINIFSKER